MPVAPRPLRAASAALLALVLLAGACAGERPALGDPQPTTTTTGPTTTTTAPAPVFHVATADEKSVDVYDSADAESPARQIVSGVDTSVDTIPVVFLLAGDYDPDADRVEVYLPVRPNGSTGFVNAGDVTVTTVPYRIEVTLAAHNLKVYDGYDVVVDAPIGVGTSDTPSPGGTYYLKELLQPPNPNGAYGHYAYGLSGFSNVLQSFAGGSGVIGIHGTNDPSTIGTDVSHGCIRLNNDVVDKMVEDIGLPLGTPVEIKA
jgi:lipoprotein-anchoring transpeptidase ErfK/SrfK